MSLPPHPRPQFPQSPIAVEGRIFDKFLKVNVLKLFSKVSVATLFKIDPTYLYRHRRRSLINILGVGPWKKYSPRRCAPRGIFFRGPTPRVIIIYS